MRLADLVGRPVALLLDVIVDGGVGVYGNDFDPRRILIPAAAKERKRKRRKKYHWKVGWPVFFGLP